MSSTLVSSQENGQSPFQEKELFYTSAFSKASAFFSKYDKLHKLSLNARLASLISAIKNSFPSEKLNFVGVYLVMKKQIGEVSCLLNEQDEVLEIGPYMSDIIATPIIEHGKGVCGTSWKENKTVIVSDVSVCNNYIACDDVTKSEIVIPIKDQITGDCLGVLDIDSTEGDYFSTYDKDQLEKLVKTYI